MDTLTYTQIRGQSSITEMSQPCRNEKGSCTVKAGIVEIFNRTVLEGMSPLIEHRDSNLYLMVLQMATTAHIIADTAGTSKTLQSTLKVGDHVRMVGPRRVFACVTMRD